MFAESVELLPKSAFIGLLQAHRNNTPATLQQMLSTEVPESEGLAAWRG